MITYAIGDATCPHGEGPRVIVHVCNDIGRWGAGFSGALSKRWSAPEREYLACIAHVLGSVQFVAVESRLWVANLIGQHGVGRATVPIRYLAIEQGLVQVASFARRHGASVHMPRIGTGLAGGSWSIIAPIVVATLHDVPVTVYDLAPTHGFS